MNKKKDWYIIIIIIIIIITIFNKNFQGGGKEELSITDLGKGLGGLASGAFSVMGVSEEIKLDIDPCLELIELEKIL